MQNSQILSRTSGGMFMSKQSCCGRIVSAQSWDCQRISLRKSCCLAVHLLEGLSFCTQACNVCFVLSLSVWPWDDISIEDLWNNFLGVKIDLQLTAAALNPFAIRAPLTEAPGRLPRFLFPFPFLLCILPLPMADNQRSIGRSEESLCWMLDVEWLACKWLACKWSWKAPSKLLVVFSWRPPSTSSA